MIVGVFFLDRLAVMVVAGGAAGGGGEAAVGAVGVLGVAGIGGDGGLLAGGESHGGDKDRDQEDISWGVHGWSSTEWPWVEEQRVCHGVGMGGSAGA